MTASATRKSHHYRSLILLAFANRALVYGLTQLGSSLLPLFDESPETMLDPKTSWLNWLAFPLLRWDTFHFLHKAEHDASVYEYEWAFFPGISLVMRTGSAVLRLLTMSGAEETTMLLLGGAILSLTCDVASKIVLYELSLVVLENSKLAYMSSLLSLLQSSPVTLSMAPYTEPFFNLFSYYGMLLSAKRQFLLGSLSFSIASLFRANGIFLCGFILWGLIVQPLLEKRSIPRLVDAMKAVVYAAIPFVPFTYHHLSAFALFCSNPEQIHNGNFKWCVKFPPLVYPEVQTKYWNVGFLRYWTVPQIPNFIIASPPIILLVAYSYSVIRDSLPDLLQSPSRSGRRNRLTSVDLVPHALYTLFTCAILVFNSHTQIVLRFGTAMPTLYWGAAWLLVYFPSLGNMWITWSIVWGLGLSIGLWAFFLPPA